MSLTNETQGKKLNWGLIAAFAGCAVIDVAVGSCAINTFKDTNPSEIVESIKSTAQNLGNSVLSPPKI